jgi:hypothetical protein
MGCHNVTAQVSTDYSRDYSADYKVKDSMPQQTHPVIKVHHAQVALVQSGLDDA